MKKTTQTGTKTTSAPKIVANRANAERSTGPRTARGKARSARNAIRHGLLARETFIDDGRGAENPADFDQLLDALTQDLKPRGAFEQILVERITGACWRLRRVHRFEIGAIRKQFDNPHPSTLHDDDDPSTADRAQKQLDDARTNFDYETEGADWARHQPDITCDESWGRLDPAWDILAKDNHLTQDLDFEQQAHRRKLLQHLQSKGLTDGPLRDALIAAQKQVVQKHRRVIDQLQSRFTQAQNAERLEQRHTELQNAIPLHDDLDRVLRYESLIDRELNRVLNQLERRQAARKDRRRPPAAVDPTVDTT